MRYRRNFSKALAIPRANRSPVPPFSTIHPKKCSDEYPQKTKTPCKNTRRSSLCGPLWKQKTFTPIETKNVESLFGCAGSFSTTFTGAIIVNFCILFKKIFKKCYSFRCARIPAYFCGNTSMNWHTLYSPQRTGDPPRKSANPDSFRTSYIRDYDRLIFSSPFRRLQGKTQVFPLPGPVFVHNRLTHSLEVASVGRSLGKAAGELLADKYGVEYGDDFKDFYRHELAAVVGAACLAHDIGNPPFGHSGEDAIRAYFTGLEGMQRQLVQDSLSENQRRDFEAFEGNANAFRILTQSFGEPEPGGERLTYTTLASVIKYPCASAAGFNKKTGLIATKKSGFFDSEKTIYRNLAAALEIEQQPGIKDVYTRHPFVFLVEAADDLCYRIIDLEDAHRLGIVSLKTIEDLFLPFFSDATGYNSAEYVQRKLSGIRDDNKKVQFIRAKWIGLMVSNLTAVFMENEAAMLAGTLNKSLLDCLPVDELAMMAAIDAHSVKHVYGYPPVIEIEVAGYHVIGGLLKEFVGAVLQPGSLKAKHVLRLVSTQYPVSSPDLYSNVQSVVDFVSGMTDLYAMDLYRKMTGISIPQLR